MNSAGDPAMNKTGTEIYLVRHGDLDKGPGRCYVGQMDFPLSPLGIRQANALRDVLSTVRFRRIVSSDLIRTRTTADIIAEKQMAKIDTDPAFREISLGDWEGLSFEAVMERYPEEYANRGKNLPDHRPPGGENFRQLGDRAWPAFSRLAAKPMAEQGNGPLLLVTHVGVIRVLLCRILNLPLENMFLLHHDYGAFTTLRPKEGRFILTGFNSRTRRD